MLNGRCQLPGLTRAVIALQPVGSKLLVYFALAIGFAILFIHLESNRGEQVGEDEELSTEWLSRLPLVRSRSS